MAKKQGKNQAQTERENQMLREQLQVVQAEKDHLRQQVPEVEAPFLYMDKLFHEMGNYSKINLIRDCGAELKAVFVMAPINKRSADPVKWDMVMDRLVDSLETFIEYDSGKPWKIRKWGCIDCLSKDPDNLRPTDHDEIRIMFWHPAKKQPKLKDPNESPTPNPVPARLSVTIRKNDVFAN